MFEKEHKETNNIPNVSFLHEEKEYFFLQNGKRFFQKYCVHNSKDSEGIKF